MLPPPTLNSHTRITAQSCRNQKVAVAIFMTEKSLFFKKKMKTSLELCLPFLYTFLVLTGKLEVVFSKKPYRNILQTVSF